MATCLERPRFIVWVAALKRFYRSWGVIVVIQEKEEENLVIGFDGVHNHLQMEAKTIPQAALSAW